MSSLFDKDSGQKASPPPYSRDLIEKEIGHLKNRDSVRHRAAEKRSLAQFLTGAVVLIFVGLFCLDPFLYSYHRGDAIQAYIYLHNYGDDKLAGALVSSGILKSSEAQTLANRQGSFQDYFVNSAEASAKANSILAFMDELAHLQKGEYEQLTWLDKIRYVLFFHFAIKTPQEWEVLNPKVK